MGWSTPLGDYRAFGTHRLMSHGEAVWHPTTGGCSYLRFDLDEIEYNVAPRRR
jgi:hypothetical protein